MKLLCKGCGSEIEYDTDWVGDQCCPNPECRMVIARPQNAQFLAEAERTKPESNFLFIFAALLLLAISGITIWFGGTFAMEGMRDRAAASQTGPGMITVALGFILAALSIGLIWHVTRCSAGARRPAMHLVGFGGVGAFCLAALLLIIVVVGVPLIVILFGYSALK